MEAPLLIYVEFKSRRPNIDIQQFHTVHHHNPSTWSASNPEDVLLFTIGRTWRLGPEPEYLVVYYTPDAGVERLADWDRIFRSGEVDALETPSRMASRIDLAACYEPLKQPTAGQGGPYYLEFFDFAGGATRAEVTEFFGGRATQNDKLRLRLVADRIGKLGPEPRGLAVWELPELRALQGIATEFDVLESAPVALVQAGVYEDIGREIH